MRKKRNFTNNSFRLFCIFRMVRILKKLVWYNKGQRPTKITTAQRRLHT
jgi:hypothetical protein